MLAYINKLSTIVETTIVGLKYKYIPAVPLLYAPNSLETLKIVFLQMFIF